MVRFSSGIRDLTQPTVVLIHLPQSRTMLAGLKTFFGATDESAEPSISIRNVSPGETVSYPLVLLEGVIEHPQALNLPETDCFIQVRVNGDASALYWPFSPSTGRFKAFAWLPAPGSYDVVLQVGPSALQIIVPITYQPTDTRHMVRFYYQKCADGMEQGFDAPEGVDNSDAAAIARIQWAALLMQTAMAELLVAQGLPRQTFAMDMEANGMPTVQLLQCSFPNETARSVPDNALHKLVEDELRAQGLHDDAERELKHAVILGCSTWNREKKVVEGHTALGGKTVGIFGSCGLHTWPQRLGDLTASCLDNTRIDETLLWDDSCHRKTHWANFSTGIGAFFHEMGHTLGLGHSITGIMGRGFDDMNRLFCLYEPRPITQTADRAFMYPTGDGRMQFNRPVLREVEGREGAHWHRASALRLNKSPWITGKVSKSSMGPMVSMDQTTRGPLGRGEFDGDQRPFGERWANGEQLGAIVIDAGQFVNSIEVYSKSEVAAWSDAEYRASGTRHLFVLMDDEYIEHIDVRAAAWVDGLQIQTNRRLSRWFGGYGGQLNRLKAPRGCCLSGMFWTHGDKYVGRVGVYIAPVPSTRSRPSGGAREESSASSNVQHSPKAGLGAGDGDQWQFVVQEAAISAIAIKCDKYVESFHILTLLEHATQSANQEAPTFAPNEHLFELVDGERIIAIEVNAGNWVDSIRICTNFRKSPWFGGQGGNKLTIIEAPAGHYICGFYGTHGNRYLGSIGTCYCEASGDNDHSQSPVLSEEDQQMLASVETQDDVLNGVVVALQDGILHTVESFTSTESFENVVNLVHASSGRGVEVLCYPLQAGELLVQIDLSVRPENGSEASSRDIVEGICFHSSFGCSTWFGKYTESSLTFLFPAKGSAFQSVKGIRETGSVIRVETACEISSPQLRSRGFEADARAFVPERMRDVRIESSSQFGVHSFFLMKRNGSAMDDFKAWSYDQFALASCPSRWMIPFQFFFSHIEGSSPMEEFQSSYVVSAMDEEGACGH